MRTAAYVAQFVGAFAATFFISRLFARLLSRHWYELKARAVAVATTCIIATVLYAFGESESGALAWARSAAVYVPAALFVLGIEISVMAARGTLPEALRRSGGRVLVQAGSLAAAVAAFVMARELVTELRADVAVNLPPVQQAMFAELERLGQRDALLDRLSKLPEAVRAESSAALTQRGLPLMSDADVVAHSRIVAQLHEALPPQDCRALSLGSSGPHTVDLVNRGISSLSSPEQDQYGRLTARAAAAALRPPPNVLAFAAPNEDAVIAEAMEALAGTLAPSDLDRFITTAENMTAASAGDVCWATVLMLRTASMLPAPDGAHYLRALYASIDGPSITP